MDDSVLDNALHNNPQNDKTVELGGPRPNVFVKSVELAMDKINYMYMYLI